MSLSQTSVIVLAAGVGTRMRSKKSKVMHHLAGLPMINHVLNTLRAMNTNDVTIVISPEMEPYSDHFNDCKTVIQSQRLGTGHAVRTALEDLKDLSETVLIVYGDTPLISSETLGMLVKEQSAGADLAVLAFQQKGSNSYGRLITEGNSVRSIIEASESSSRKLEDNLCNSGIMAVSGKKIRGWVNALKNDNSKKEYFLTDIVEFASQEKSVCIFVEGKHQELVGINTRSELAEAEKIMQDAYREKFMSEGVSLQDPSSVFFSYDTKIGQDAHIGPFTVFGPGVTLGNEVSVKGFCYFEDAFVGDKAVIGPYARLRPGTSLENDVRVGNFVEIKNTHVKEGAKVNHLAYVGDAKVGKDSNIGAGTITANYDGYNKSKTNIGERVSIGSNSVLVAPVDVGDDVITGAGSVVRKDIPSDSISVTKGDQKITLGGASKYRAQKKLKAQKDNEDL